MSVRRSVGSYRQQCAECGARTTRDHVTATRTAGGNYRTPPRRYRSTICVPCATDIAALPRPDAHRVGAGHWDHGSVVHALGEYQARRDWSGEPPTHPQ